MKRLIPILIFLFILVIAIAPAVNCQSNYHQWRMFNAGKPFPQSGLIHWFDSRNSSTITADLTGAVSSWKDILSAGTVSQSIAQRQPNYTGSTGVIFDGAAGSNGDRLGTTTITDIAQPYTLFIALTYNSIGAGSAWIIDGSAGAQYGAIYASGTTLYFYGGSTLSVSNFNTSANYIITNVANSTSSSLQLNNNTAATGDGGTRNPAGILISQKGDNGQSYYIGMNVYEILIYNRALTSDEIAAVKSYLTIKWGL